VEGERNQAVELFGSTLIVVQGTRAPHDAEWRESMVYTRRILGSIRGQLVVSVGGGPTPQQRKELLDLFANRPGGTPPTAVITSSVVARGIVTAFAWFVKDRIKAFGPEQFVQACAFVGAREDADALRSVVERLQSTLLEHASVHRKAPRGR
jgi:hypothetical protein